MPATPFCHFKTVYKNAQCTMHSDMLCHAFRFNWSVMFGEWRRKYDGKSLSNNVQDGWNSMHALIRKCTPIDSLCHINNFCFYLIWCSIFYCIINKRHMHHWKLSIHQSRQSAFYCFHDIYNWIGMMHRFETNYKFILFYAENCLL